MGKPVKIHKKKSFMFTTRHHTFLGWMATITAILAFIMTVLLVIESYNMAGRVALSFGWTGMFLVILAILGIVSGITALGERDAIRTTPIVGISVNSAVIVAWVFVIVIALFK